MKIFFQKHKYHLAILVGLLVLVGVSAYYAYREPRPQMTDNQSAPITVTMRIDETLEAQTELPAGATVFTLMDTLEKNGQLSFRAKDFGGALGVFIEEINSVPNTRERYWIYYINNQKANAGVSNYTLQSGDIISWKYETEKDL